MSLTSFLSKNADVRQRFRQEFSLAMPSCAGELRAPPLTQKFSLVGTAFDYLFRFHLQRFNSCAIDSGSWVAESAIPLLADFPDLQKRALHIVNQARQEVGTFLRIGECREALLVSCLLLAGLDPIFRANRGHDNIGAVDENDVRDLANLLNVLEISNFIAKQHCWLNPGFGLASVLMGGADADVIIDDILIEIKTTKNQIWRRDYFDQLMGYYILHQLNLVEDAAHKPTINRIAVYSARYGHFHAINIQEVINSESFPRFVEWFVMRAVPEFGFGEKLAHDLLEGRIISRLSPTKS